MHVLVVEYVWISDYKNCVMRSKSRTIPKSFESELTANTLPEWNYDGSSTGEAIGNDSEIILKPRRIYKDPFYGTDHILVLCDTFYPDGRPTINNNRVESDKIFKKKPEEEPWYGIEQEYFIIPKDGLKIDQFNPQGQYYCSVGYGNAFYRKLAQKHYHMSLQAGIPISGINAEVAPYQWEFQVGPVEGIKAGDDLWMARFILMKLSEEFEARIDLTPKPFSGDWNGSGAHVNFSTKRMREDGGIKYIHEAIDKLQEKHDEHIKEYGEGNENRLTGKHETASMDKFSWGVADRGASVRIGRETEKNGKGYLEDRRPASSMDPYVVTSKIFETIAL